ECGASAHAVCRQVRGPERAGLAEPDRAVVGRDAGDRRRQALDNPAAGQLEGAVDVRDVVPVDVDPGDLHPATLDGAARGRAARPRSRHRSVQEPVAAVSCPSRTALTSVPWSRSLRSAYVLAKSVTAWSKESPFPRYAAIACRSPDRECALASVAP